MSAAPRNDNPLPARPNAESFVAETQKKFFDLVHDLRAAAKMTATEGWQSAYRQNIDNNRRAVKQLAENIAAEAKYIAEHGTNEENEKAIKEAVKGLADEREIHGAWWLRTVQKIETAAKNAADMRHEIKTAARAEEKDRGLIANGLGDEVAEIVNRWSLVDWDAELGVVTVTEPSGVE